MKEDFISNIQARITPSMREKVEKHKGCTGLSDADIVRLALKKFLAKVTTSR